MPSKVSIVRVDGGLVTSKEPSDLAEGELVQADDAMYKPNDKGIHKARGRTAFNSTVEPNGIRGARYVEFDGGSTDLLITRSDVSWRKADAAKSGTFADLVTGLAAPTTAFAVHYNNKHYLMDGVERNRTVSSDGTAVFHSMLAETGAPILGADAGSGDGFTMTAGQTMKYWVEERVKDGDTVLRRNGTTSDEVVTLTSDGNEDKPRLTHASATNSDATHWALYATAANGAYPTGAEIDEVVIATTFIDDDRTDTSVPSGAAYQAVSVNLAGVTTNIARNGPAPIATTGCIFEDSLVTNDVNNLRYVVYSYPDTPDSFPSVNAIFMETSEQDEVVILRRMGPFVIVGMRDSMWRINILPRPEDSAFEIERVKDQIDGAFGIVGPLAGTTFSFGAGIRFAYVSLYGIVVTDGASWDVIVDDVDWENTVEVGELSKSVLVNNPNMYRLEFYYTPKGGGANTRCLYLHYHPSHAKRPEGGGFRAKVSGPIRVQGTTAMPVNLDGQRFIYTGDGGTLYVEGEGAIDNSNAGGIQFVVKTGDRYLHGVGGQGRINKAWLHHSAAPDRTGTMTVTQRNAGEDDETTGDEDQNVALDRREMTIGSVDGLAEAFNFAFSNDDEKGDVRVNYFVVDVEDLERTKQP